MRIAMGVGIPPSSGNIPPPAPYKRPQEEIDEEIAASKTRRKRLLIVASVILILVVIGAAYYFYEYSPYGTTVISTSPVTGTISGVSDATVALPNGNAQPTQSPNARITISVGSDSFTTFVACWPAPYKVGQMVNVNMQTLRNGNHAYVASLVCRGGTGVGGGSGFTSSTTTSATSSH